MRSVSSATPILLTFLLLLVSSTSSLQIHESFLICLSLHSPHFNQNTQLIYTQNNSAFYSIFQSSIRNPRFLNPTTPKPLLIIVPTDESQIQATVICCKNLGLQIKIRSGGHDYEGLSYTANSPFIIVDLRNLRSVQVNTEDNTAWVQGGAQLGEVYYYIAEKTSSYGFPAGLCPTVGVGGHFSGGGLGTLMRKYGLAADNIIDARIIDVHSQILDRKSMGEDLFWAIRGGGAASFGVVASWKIKLVPIPPIVTVFTISKTLDQGATKLMYKWQQIAHKFPNNLFIRTLMGSVKGGNKGGRTIHAAFNSMYLGVVEELLPLMENIFPELGLEAKDCNEVSWIESIIYFAGYPIGTPVSVLLDRSTRRKSALKAKSDFVKEPIPENVLKNIADRLLEEKKASLIMDPLGGRMGEILESEIPYPYREGYLYNIQHLVEWEDIGVEASQGHLDWMRRFYEFMEPYVSKYPRAAFFNYKDLDLGMNEEGNASYWRGRLWGEKYFFNNFKRLALVKGKVDPGNFFRDKQNIPPLLA
ncbi:tetrahydroberberine oxidase-like [Tasmannia lanceolata]|uniref:tetrahydroberberine oxidase-like n=1 Tax=Tasmannia lanceolata TaxID=3420 RepID=UPI004063419F